MPLKVEKSDPIISPLCQYMHSGQFRRRFDVKKALKNISTLVKKTSIFRGSTSIRRRYFNGFLLGVEKTSKKLGKIDIEVRIIDCAGDIHVLHSQISKKVNKNKFYQQMCNHLHTVNMYIGDLFHVQQTLEEIQLKMMMTKNLSTS